MIIWKGCRRRRQREPEKSRMGETKVRAFRFPRMSISAVSSPAAEPMGYITWGKTKTEIRKCCMMIRKKPAAQIERGSQKPEQTALKKCITNTDKADREIKKLKEQKGQLERQIKAVSGDEEKVKELEQKLSQIESELSQKDNDTYRRQNAVIS